MKTKQITILTTLVAALLSIGCEEEKISVTNDGIVAFYPFNGNTRDESGNTHHAANMGVTFATDRFGNDNSAVEFDGSSSYLLVNSSNLFPAAAITTAFWINRNNLDPSQIGSGENYINKELSFSTYLLTDGSLISQVWKGQPGVWSEWFDGDYEMPVSQDWIFYTNTFDNKTKTVNIFINGELVNTMEETNSDAIVRQSVMPLFIGRNGSSPVYFIQGMMDDIRIYDRALRLDEIQTLYKN